MGDILGGNTKLYHGEFIKLVTTLRHYNISVICVSQHIKAIAPILRSNSDFSCIYKLNGNEAIKIIIKELINGNEDIKKLLEEWDKCTNNYKFVCVDNTLVNNDTVGRITCSIVDPKVLKLKL